MRVKQSNKCLGSGGVGSVFQGIDIDTMRAIAIKEVHVGQPESGYGTDLGSSKNNTPSSIGGTRHTAESSLRNSGSASGSSPHEIEVSGRIKAEIDLMKKISHPNIVQYYGSDIEDLGAVVKIYMELLPGGSVGELVRSHGPVREATVRSFVRDVLRGLHYLHTVAHVCHRDIKPDNILLTLDGQCKLSDFGVSKHVGGGDNLMKTCVGTAQYMAPEVVNNEGYSFSSDLWSVGCVVIELLTGEPPFGVMNPVAVLFQIGSMEAIPQLGTEVLRKVTSNCADFVDKVMQRDPTQRLTAGELLRHPWIQDIESRTFLGNASTIQPAFSGGGALGDSSTRGGNSGGLVDGGMGSFGDDAAAVHAAKLASEKAELQKREKEKEEKEKQAAVADLSDFPGLKHEEEEDQSMLPQCDRCHNSVALFSCDTCKKISFPSRLCPTCWREVHQHHRSSFHRKLPLLLPVGGTTPEPSPSPSRGSSAAAKKAQASSPSSSRGATPNHGQRTMARLQPPPVPPGGLMSPLGNSSPQILSADVLLQAQRGGGGNLGGMKSPLSTASPAFKAALVEPPPALGSKREALRKQQQRELGGSPTGSPKTPYGNFHSDMSPHSNCSTPRHNASFGHQATTRSTHTPGGGDGYSSNRSGEFNPGAGGGGDGGFYCAETAEYVDIYPREKCVWECGKCSSLNDSTCEQCSMCDHTQ